MVHVCHFGSIPRSFGPGRQLAHISVERSTFVTTLDGGIAQMMSQVLHSIFCSTIVDPRLGFRLKGPNGDPSGDITMYLDFQMVLADGAAQKLVWSSKGDAGTKYCILCANVHTANKTT